MVALFCVGAIVALRGGPLAAVRAPESSRGAALKSMLACGGLLVTFSIELWIVRVADLTQVPFTRLMSEIPLLYIDASGPLMGHTPPWVRNDLLAVALVQTVLLYVLYRAVKERTVTLPERVTLVAACAAMIGGALLSRYGADASDLYLYVGSAHLGAAAYTPPGTPFTGELAPISRMWGTPLFASAYGPLWLFVSGIVTKASHTLWGQLQALRIFSAALFVACIFLFRALRVDGATTALFALNPALVFQFVLDGHNDLLPLTLALCAIALAPRRPWIALLCAALAGAAKLPFTIVAALAFGQLEKLTQRVAFAAGAFALAIAATYAFSHGHYFSSVHYELVFQLTHSPVIRFMALASAGLAAFLAIVFRRFLTTASWSFLSFGPFVLPWYVAWGVPYAILERSFLPVYLLALPLVTLDLAIVFDATLLSRALYAAIALSPLLVLVLTMRGRLRTL